MLHRPAVLDGRTSRRNRGELAAACVATVLRNPKLAIAAGASYERLYLAQYRHFHDMAQLFYGTNRARDSYFWEARRLTGEAHLEPRTAFVRAISGQAPFQVERSALSRAALPEDFAQALDRRPGAHTGLPPKPTLETRVLLAPGLLVRAQAVLGDGCFEMGHVIAGAGRDDLPVSTVEAELARCAVGGSRGEIAERIDGVNDKDGLETLLSAAQLMLAEGVLELAR